MAIVVSNGCKSFGGKEVLKNVNMKVELGTIYGLLGASGCGKTTLLSCVLGLQQLHKGDIRTSGGKLMPSDRSIVGYMPQDISLYTDFTVKETLHFFGNINNMPNSTVKIRLKFLTEFLMIEVDKKYVGQYSGGQQRRISLIVALFHDPQLLVLDEPTVGLDSILRNRVWCLLLGMVSKKRKTIIITTHYTEEARKANKIGFMDNGKILVEGPPEELMRTYHVLTLEELFINVLKAKESSPNTTDTSFCDEVSDSTSKRTKSFDDKTDEELTFFSGTTTGIKHIIPLLIKNYKRLFRNKLYLLFILILPILILHSLCNSMAPMKGLNYGVINQDEASKQNYTFCSANKTPTELILESLHSKGALYLTPYSNHESGISAVKNGDIWGIMEIPQNFSFNFIKRLMEGVLADNVTLLLSEISVTADSTNSVIRESVQFSILNSIVETARILLSSCNFTFQQPMIFKNMDPIYGKKSTGTIPQIFTGQIITIEYLLTAVIAAIILSDEDSLAVSERILLSGVSQFTQIFSYFILFLIVVILQVIILTLGVMLPYGIVVEGSLALSAVLLVLQGAGGFALGFLVSTFTKSPVSGTILNFTFACFVMNMSGVLTPREGFGPFFGVFCQLLPIALPAESNGGIILKGWGLLHQKVYLGFIVICVWTVGCFILAVVVRKIKKS